MGKSRQIVFGNGLGKSSIDFLTTSGFFFFWGNASQEIVHWDIYWRQIRRTRKTLPRLILIAGQLVIFNQNSRLLRKGNVYCYEIQLIVLRLLLNQFRMLWSSPPLVWPFSTPCFSSLSILVKNWQYTKVGETNFYKRYNIALLTPLLKLTMPHS